jgi:hypothetical protein
MKQLKYISAAIIVIGLVFTCMPLSDSGQDKIIGDYHVSWIDDPMYRTIVVSYTKDNPNTALHVLTPQVFAYGNNDKFIIAKQHPIVGEFASTQTVNDSITNYFIIKCRQDIDTEKVFGPLSQENFIRLKDSLKINEISFTNNLEVER